MANVTKKYQIKMCDVSDTEITAHIIRLEDKDEIYHTIQRSDFEAWLSYNDLLTIEKAFSQFDEHHSESVPVTTADYFAHATEVNDAVLIIDLNKYLLGTDIAIAGIDLLFANDELMTAVDIAIKDASNNNPNLNAHNMVNVKMHLAMAQIKQSRLTQLHTTYKLKQAV